MRYAITTTNIDGTDAMTCAVCIFWKLYGMFGTWIGLVLDNIKKENKKAKISSIVLFNRV